jgi:tetratricopeptide (TPR) repeat protein
MITQSDTLELIAARLADRYALERELGRGGMATVYLARDLRHGRLVALKFLRPELSSVLGAERFEREIGIAARLSHPHILPLLDSGALEGSGLGTILYYAMPYVEGRSLRERMTAEPQLPIEEAVGLAGQVAQALEHAHRQGIIHRDIKPENILLSEGQAVVADFGIARALDVAGAERLTETGLAIGTPAYMSPEQGLASARVDGRSDLYSLACVLYEMLAGQPPFTGSSPQAVLARHAVDPVPPLRSVRSTVPRALEQVIERVLAKVPADRYATAAAFAAALEAALTAAPGAETVVTPVRRFSRRTWVMVATVAGLALMSGGTAVLRLRRPAPIYEPARVVVAPLENQTGDSTLDQLARRLVTGLPDAIAREGVGDPVPAATVRDLLARAKGSPGEVADRLARETRAGLELRGVCTRSGAVGATCQVDVLQMPAKTLRLSVSLSGDPAVPAFGAGLTERVLVALLLQQKYGDQVKWQGEYITPSLAAARAWVASEPWWRREYNPGVAGDPARLDTAWAAAVARATEDSSQAAAETTLVRLARRPGLLQGERESVGFYLELRRGEWDRAFELANSRFAVNPVWWRLQLVVVAQITGRAHRAVEVSREPEPTSIPPGTGPDIGTYLMRGYALHQLGRYREELQVAREIARRWPGEELYSRTHEVMALVGLGLVDSLRVKLSRWEGSPEPKAEWAGTRALIAGHELMAHGHEREGREMLAGTLPFYRRLRESGEGGGATFWSEVAVLQATGSLGEARRLIQAALRTSTDVTDSVNCLGALGGLAADQGRRAEAVRYDRMLAAVNRRADVSPVLSGFVTFTRAQLAARLGDKQGAVRLLEQARRRGDDSAAHTSVHRDPAFASLRDYPPFQRFLEPRD